MTRTSALVVFISAALVASAAEFADIPGDAVMTTNANFLLLDANSSDGKSGRHVMILRKSLMDRLVKGIPADQYDTAAASTAGMLYATRSGAAVNREAVEAAGAQARSAAIVRHFRNVAQLPGIPQVPAGWDEPVVAVSWETTAAYGIAGQTITFANGVQTHSFFSGSSATNTVQSQGAEILRAADDTLSKLTGDVLALNSQYRIVVGSTVFVITPETRVCGRDGQRIALQDIPQGEKVLTISALGDNRAQSVRVGVMQSSVREPGSLDRIDNYTCQAPSPGSK